MDSLTYGDLKTQTINKHVQTYVQTHISDKTPSPLVKPYHPHVINLNLTYLSGVKGNRPPCTSTHTILGVHSHDITTALLQFIKTLGPGANAKRI